MDTRNSFPNANQATGTHRYRDRPLVERIDLARAERPVPFNLPGSELSVGDFAALEGRWIDRALAEAAFLRRVDSFTGSQLVGRRGGDYAGIVIPYFAPASQQVREYRLRRDHPDLEAGPDGVLKVRQKYLSPPGRGNMLYLSPDCEEVRHDAG